MATVVCGNIRVPDFSCTFSDNPIYIAEEPTLQLQFSQQMDHSMKRTKCAWCLCPGSRISKGRGQAVKFCQLYVVPH